jgi:glycosyltransferase involved in cell wall biosynthesis
MPKKKLRVIHIMSSPPPYSAYSNSARPQINFDTPTGNWVGICGYDWTDLLSEEVFKVNESIDFEVWQPDPRAERVYSHKFKQGFTHRLFPARHKSVVWGLKRRKVLVCDGLINEINNEKTSIIHTHGDLYGHKRLLKYSQGIRIIHTFHGVINLPFKDMFKLRRNFMASFNYLIEHFFLKRHINNINLFTYMNERNLGDLTDIYKGKVENLTMGVDFDFWKPAKNKILAKAKYNLSSETIVFTSVSRLIPIKQIDKAIMVLNQIEQKQDLNFIFFIGGSGDDAYEEYLRLLAKDLMEKGKVKFVGYLDDQEVRNLYHATDLFMLNSTNEGCPVSVIKALACHIPVFTTNVGHTAALLKQEKAGVVVSVDNYDSWEEELTGIMRKRKVVKLDRDIAYNHYNWGSIARRVNDIYLTLEEN